MKLIPSLRISQKLPLALIGSAVVVAAGVGIASYLIASNALEGQARLALARDDLPHAQAVVARLLKEAGVDPQAVLGAPAAGENDPLGGANKPLVHLTVYRVWAQAGDLRADAALAEAHRCVQAVADAITDTALRQGYLNNLVENREIVARWKALQGSVGR